MKITFHGAARTITGSKHLLTIDNGTQILLDCGLFQGCGGETDSLNADFGFDPSAVSLVILSHAHIDHSGLLPKLVKEGFNGKILSTPATRDLTQILLYDSAEIQKYAAHLTSKKGKQVFEIESLFTTEDVDFTLSLFETLECGEWVKISDGVELQFTNAGHLAGSAVVNLRIEENKKTIRLAYSGDIGRYRSVLLAPPQDFPQADYIILESTYGNKYHDINYNSVDTLLKAITDTCIRKKGKLVIPAFSVGRTQELLYTLNQLELEKRLPPLNYFVDSPLSLKATEVIKKYVHNFNDRMQKVLEVDDDPFLFEGLKHIESVEDSVRLTEFEEPCVIISASGMAEGGRVRHHIHACVEDQAHTILMAGYCGKQSLSGQLLDGAKTITLFGDECKVSARVDKVEGMSAHGDQDDLLRFMSCQESSQVKQVFLVHGEYNVSEELGEKLKRKGFARVSIPGMHQQITLD